MRDPNQKQKMSLNQIKKYPFLYPLHPQSSKLKSLQFPMLQQCFFQKQIKMLPESPESLIDYAFKHCKTL